MLPNNKDTRDDQITGKENSFKILLASKFTNNNGYKTQVQLE